MMQEITVNHFLCCVVITFIEWLLILVEQYIQIDLDSFHTVI